MKKKGFTLIELLAIIVILAIIAVITVPIILNIIENSKKGSVQDSALGYKDAVQKYYMNGLVDNKNGELPSGIKLVSALPSEFEVSGEKPTNDSWLQLEKGQVVAYSLKFGDYTVTKYKDTDVVCEKGEVKDDPSPKVGSEHCYGPTDHQECFTLIKKYTENGTSKSMLFSKYSLKKVTDSVTNEEIYIQDPISPDSIAFSGTYYWLNSNGNTLKTEYEKDLNSNTASYSGDPYPYVYDSNSNAYTYINGYLELLKKEIYGLPLSATGRLLSYEEANDTDIFENNDERKNGNQYWLGSLRLSQHLWLVYTGGGIVYDVGWYGNSYTIRPVIIVPTDSL